MFLCLGLCVVAWGLAKDLAWLARRFKKVRLLQVLTLPLSIAFRFVAIFFGAAALYAMLYCR